MCTTKDNINIFESFDYIPVSTKTFTATTNLNINLEILFNYLPVTEYKIIEKKRGRRKKNVIKEQKFDLKNGSIITLKYKDKIKGVNLKKNKNKKNKKWFRNSFTVVIIIDKIINFKICKNGTFQMTGCKSSYHAIECVKYIWNYIKDYENNIYTFKNGNNHLTTLFIPAMRNIDFSLGFNVDREKLAYHMSTQTEFRCLLETSFGYTGVNIKIPLDKDINTIKIQKLMYINNSWILEKTKYEEYLSTLSAKEQKNKLESQRYNTFLVFHSGKVIMSGINKYCMKDTYYSFKQIIETCYPLIKEKLDI